MAPISDLSHLLNPLAAFSQLETSSSQLDGVPKEIEGSVRFESARLIQTAGILLRLPQELIAQSIVILYRFWTGPDGGSLLEHDSQDVAAAAVYVTAKPSTHPITPRQLFTVFCFVCNIRPDYHRAIDRRDDLDNIGHVPEDELEIKRTRLFAIESQILSTLGFQTHVALPYTLCINYLQTMDVLQSPIGSRVAKRALAHLNSALLSPQLPYLTHQPSALATAAIYLAANEVEVKLPEVEWWEVFDVDREELGFLVVAMQSVEGFTVEEQSVWGKRSVPLTVDELQAVIERGQMLEAGA